MYFKDDAKRKDLNDILLELAKDENFNQDKARKCSMYQRLECIYYNSDGNKFRHYYSDMFSVIVMIHNDQRVGDVNTLCANLSDIMCGYRPMNKDKYGKIIDISDNIRKLYDHVNLDVSRINLSDGSDRVVSGKKSISSLNTRLNALEEQLNNAKNDLNDANLKLKNQQKEYITILGIFAAIVLSFVGAFTFASSVFGNLMNVDVSKLVLVLSILGMLFFNLISYLIEFLRDINDNAVRDKDGKKVYPERYKDVNHTFLALATISVIVYILYSCRG